MDVSAALLPVAGLILVALIFDYINGFHDAANSIATVVSTRVLSPGKAVIWAAFFNFAAAARRSAPPSPRPSAAAWWTCDVVTLPVIFAGLMRRDPLEPDHLVLRACPRVRRTRSSAATPARRSRRPGSAPSSSPGWTKTLIFIVIAPLIGLTVGLLLMTAMFWIFRRVPPSRVDQLVPPTAAGVGRRLQPDARRQRRAEDDGDHRRRAVHGRLHHDVPYPVLGGACRATRRSASARSRAGGASSTRWDRRSRGCSRWAGLPPKRARPWRSALPPRSASGSARRTPSPARSSASAPRGACRRCAGVWRARSCGRGCSRFRRPPASPRSLYEVLYLTGLS